MRITRVVLASFAAISVIYVAPAQQEVIPNDPYFKDQVSFKNPGGKIVLNQTSTHPSPVSSLPIRASI